MHDHGHDPGARQRAHRLADVRPQPGADPLPRRATVKPPYSIRWRFKGNHLLEYSPVLVGNQLFGVNNNGMAFAVKASTGKARWKQQIAHLNASSPTYNDHVVYVSNLEPGQVVALAQSDGHVLWKHPLPGRTESSPLVVGNKVIVGCECNTVFALDKATGETIWERHVNGAVKAAPAYEDGVVYIGDYSGEMSAIRVGDGSIKWQAGSQGSGFGRSGRFYATAAVAFGRVYAGNRGRADLQLRPAEGDLAWSHSTGSYVYAAASLPEPRTPSRRSTSAPTTGRSTRLTPGPATSAGASRTWRAISGAASLIGDTAYVADLKTTSTYGFDIRNGHRVFQYPDGAYNPVVSNGKGSSSPATRPSTRCGRERALRRTGSSRSSRRPRRQAEEGQAGEVGLARAGPGCRPAPSPASPRRSCSCP